MIPAIIAAPIVQGVVGSVIGGVMNAFAPPQPAPTAFNPYLSRVTLPQKLTGPFAPIATSTGTMNSSQWSSMSTSEMQSFTKGLAGRHVDATDESGRTISGTVNGTDTIGHAPALNIGGHLVTLSQLKQITWSATAA